MGRHEVVSGSKVRIDQLDIVADSRPLLSGALLKGPSSALRKDLPLPTSKMASLSDAASAIDRWPITPRHRRRAGGQGRHSRRMNQPVIRVGGVGKSESVRPRLKWALGRPLCERVSVGTADTYGSFLRGQGRPHGT